MLEGRDSCHNYSTVGNIKCESLKIMMTLDNQQPSSFKMEKVHRLCTNLISESSKMKTFRERAEELALSCKRVKENNVYEVLAKEFGISKRTAGDRFKSLFRMPVRDFISKNLVPTKNEIIDHMIQSENWNDFHQKTRIGDTRKLASLLNQYFGRSNYFQIKNSLRARILVENYNPTREDNESILISQILGDGSIERDSCLKIEHGHKQYEYLKFKIGLLNTAFPQTNGLESIRKRIQTLPSGEEYLSFSYRTGQVLGKQIMKLRSCTLDELVNQITPFGISLYYLDDGYFSKSLKHDTWELGFSMINSDLQDSLIKYFCSFGYEFSSNPKAITLRSKPIIIRFIKDFLEPYAHIIPECMHYKFELKDIVESCEGELRNSGNSVTSQG